MAILATAVWRIRPSGSDTNGGGFDTGISGYGTDYSQQNTAQASGTAGAATTATFTDATANAFTSAMVGNAMYITGGGATAGFYFVTGYTSASTVTLDRAPGTAVSGATWYLGGGWSTVTGNLTNTAIVQPGNTVYILGSGNPNPSSYTFDYTISSYVALISGNSTAGNITIAGDPNTPSGGMPCIKTASSNGMLWYSGSYLVIKNIWVVASSTFSGWGMIVINGTIIGCVFDQNGYDISCGYPGGSIMTYIDCEMFSSVAPRGASTQVAMALNNYGSQGFNCNVHDTVAGGVNMYCGTALVNSIVAKCRGVGVTINPNYGMSRLMVANCTIDGNTGDGIQFTGQNGVSLSTVFNNIVSNHTISGTYGIHVTAGTTAENDSVASYVDFNAYYNNTTNYGNLSASPNDTAVSTDPYVAQSTENYTLASGGLTYLNGAPGLPFKQHMPSQTTTVQTYSVPGGVQPEAGGGSSGGGLFFSGI